MNLKELKSKKISELTTMAKHLGLEGVSGMRKQELIFSLLQTEI
jgi:transcription termination factor Rho